MTKVLFYDAASDLLGQDKRVGSPRCKSGLLSLAGPEAAPTARDSAAGRTPKEWW
jgi:hypothetical protein